MARSRYTFFADDSAPYFLTLTTVNWLPLFSNPDIASILIESLRYLITNQRLELYAYVIMENHLHLIAGSDDLSDQIAKFKSYTARRCVDYYQQHNLLFFLYQLAGNKLPGKADRQFQFWQEGSHPESILDEGMLEQKVAYIHNNPVRRGYVELAEHWRYSSARNYAGLEGVLPVARLEEG